MRVVITADGRSFPKDAVSWETAAIKMVFFKCLSCGGTIAAPTDETTVHVCGEDLDNSDS
jgi:hypothetical protein